MGDMSNIYGDTSTSFTDGTGQYWIYSNSDSFYKITKKKKKKEFISEDEFKI
jgi:hypothetical protein